MIPHRRGAVAASSTLSRGPGVGEPAPAPTVPAAPVLTGSPGNGQVGLGWTEPDDGGSPIIGYELQRNATTTIYDALVPRSYIDTGRTNGVSVAYRVRAENAIGFSDWSSTVNVTPAAPVGTPTVPSAPVLTGTPGDTYADLGWNAPSDGGSPILRYELQRDAVKIQEDLSLGRHDTGLTNGTIYTYRVRAENAVGNGEWSNFLNVMPVDPPVPDTVPEAPILTGTPGDQVSNLTWSQPADGGATITGYELERIGGAGTVTVGTSVTGKTAAGTSCTVACTVGAGSDRALIVAVSWRRSPTLRSVSSVTFNGDPLFPIPGAKATVPSSFMGAELWGMVAPDVATGNIVVTMDGVCNIDVCGQPMAGVHQSASYGTAVADTNTTANPTLIVASESGGAVIDCLSAVTAGAISVGAGQTERANQSTTGSEIVTQGVSTEAGAGSVVMSWTRDADIWAMVAVPIKAAASATSKIYDALAPRSFVDTGRTNGTPYVYRVKAENAEGFGPYSADVTVTPAAPSGSVPAAPVLTTVAGNNSATSTWTAPAPGGSAIIRYELYRGFTLVYSGLTPRSFVDSVPNGQSQTYFVVAVNAFGMSPASNLQSVVPNPPNPGSADLPADVLAGKAAWHFAAWGDVNMQFASVAAVNNWRTQYGFDAFYCRFYSAGSLPGYGSPQQVRPGTAPLSFPEYEYQRQIEANGPKKAKELGAPISWGFFVKIHKPRDNDYRAFQNGPVTPHQNGDLGPFGHAWDDDAGWADVCATIKNFILTMKNYGADRYNWDPEFGTWDYPPISNRPTIATMALLRAKIDQRGFEFGKACMEADPNAHYSHYGTPMRGGWHYEVGTRNSGGAGDGCYFHSPSEFLSNTVVSAIEFAPGVKHNVAPLGPTEAYPGVDQSLQGWQHEIFYCGFWRAMATYGNNCTYTFQDAFWYHAMNGRVQYGGVPGNQLDYAMRWNLWGIYSWLSRHAGLTRATKRKLMRMFRVNTVSWIGTDSGNGYWDSQLREPEYTDLLKAGRKWGMDQHVEYFNGQEVGTPDGYMGNNAESSTSSRHSAGRPGSISFGFHPFSGQKKSGLTPKTATLGSSPQNNTPATNPTGGSWAGTAVTYLSADVATTPVDWNARYVPPASRRTGMLAACDPAPVASSVPTLSNVSAVVSGGNVRVRCRARHATHAVRRVAIFRGSTFNKANPEASLLDETEMTYEPNNGTNLPTAALTDPYQDCDITTETGGWSAGMEVVIGVWSSKDDSHFESILAT